MGAPQYEQAGADVAGSGTTNYIPRWNPGPSTLGDSGLIDNGTSIYTTTRNVGIGTASPGYKLDVISAEVRIGASAPGANTFLYLGNGVTSAGPYGVGALQYSGQAHTAVFANSGYGAARASLGMVSGGVYTPALSADPSGYVGIGTASPGAQLHVERAGGSSTNAEYLRLRNTTIATGSNASQSFFVNGNTVATGNISHAWNGTTYDTIFNVWNGSALAEAGRAIGGSTPVLSVPSGLKLPATPGNADAQTLDCYAEGTWTPTLAGFVTNTPGTIAASYTRVGRMVTLNVYLYAGGSSFGSTLGATTVTVPSGMTPNFNGVGHGGLSRTTSSVAQVIAYYDGKIYLGTSASAVTEMWVSVTYFV